MDANGIDKSTRFKMKFIGRPNGKLMKGAPGNYTQGEIYEVPFRYSKFPYWEMLDPPPVLKVPPAQVEDSVFENSVFVPPDLDNNEEKAILGVPIKIDESIKEDEAKLVTPNQEVIIKNLESPINPVESLLNSVKQKKEEPFKEESEDDMPPEIRYELESMGDGIIGEGGEEKTGKKSKKVKK